jgi:hypothetical protein
MKKLMFMCIGVCLFTTMAFAQKLTQKDLQGTWKMTAFSSEGISVDVTTEKFTLSKELEAQATPEIKQQIELGILQAMEALKESYAYFDGNNLRQTMGPQEQKGTYTLKEADGKQLLTIALPDGTSEEIVIAMKDKHLYMVQGGADGAEFVYIKQ